MNEPPRTPDSGPIATAVRLYEWLVIGLFSLLLLDVLWGVFSRYVVGHQSHWTEEVAINLFLWVSLLGAALTYRSHGHLGMDYFVGKLPPPAQRLAAILAEISVLIFAAFAMIYGGGMLVAQTLGANQVSAATGWKIGYFYSAVPLAGMFFVVFALEHLRDLWRGKTPGPNVTRTVE